MEVLPLAPMSCWLMTGSVETLKKFQVMIKTQPSQSTRQLYQV